MRGRSRRKKRTGKMVSLQKRFLAFMLAFAMIFTNVGTDLHVSFAASGNRVDFTIGGADLVDAIRQAIEDENVVSQDSLDFTDGATEKFEALFFGDGKVYEVYPDIQGDSMEAELRVFVKLPADADDTYMVTGEEEVYFLYVNNGEDTISCSTTVTRTENGKEKEKTTKRITIKSYEDKFGDEERNIISKPAETAPAEKPSEAVNEETTENVVNPTDAEKETTAAEETAEVPETKEDVEESKEQPEETKEEETEAATEAPEEITEPETEAPAETEAAEPETEASEPEAEIPAEEPAPEGEVTASISRHGVPLVAMKEDAENAADGAEPTEFTRMEKFTTLSESKNPTTYERQYVDKDSSDSDVTGYGTSWSYNFDMHENNPILMDIASVHDDELTGETRNIVVVDFFDKGEATKEDEFVARKREFSILPDASGDGTDALQYSGSFGVKSEPVKGYAKVAADGKSCTFLEKPTVG